jgi:hypothetical protein
MGFFSKKPKQLSPEEQEELDGRLIDAAWTGGTETVEALLAVGADVHARDDYALREAAYRGHADTVRLLLGSGADAHAKDDEALRWAAYGGRTQTVQILARHIFAPDFWRGKNRAEIEAEAEALYNKIKADHPQPECLHMAGTILADTALTCWEQVRPPPPKLTISPLPAQPRPL